MIVIQNLFHLISAVGICSTFAVPSFPAFLSSLITESPELVSRAGRVVLMVTQAYLVLCSAQLVPVILCPCILFMFSMPELLRELL